LLDDSQADGAREAPEQRGAAEALGESGKQLRQTPFSLAAKRTHAMGRKASRVASLLSVLPLRSISES
jgi:hypothetical protein